MAISIANLRRGSGMKPPITVLYGRPGVGKTTLAAQAPTPIFVQTEDGLTAPGLQEVETFGVLQSYEDVLDAIAAIYQNIGEHHWRTIVFDSIDRLNPLIVDYVCRQNKWTKLEDGAYGRGKVAYVDEWRRFMDVMITLRNDLGVGVIMVGHHKAARITPPDAEPYLQHTLTLPEDVSRILIGDSDLVLFATYPTTTIASDAGFNKKVNRAVTDRPRLYTTEAGSHVAKNRYNMPAFVPLEWGRLAAFVPAWSQDATTADTTGTETDTAA